jgi:hypothetical protein
MFSRVPVEQPTPPVRIREVTPDDAWFEDSSIGDEPSEHRRSLIEQERGLPPEERAVALYFDLGRQPTAAEGINRTLKWIDRYWANRRPDDYPVSLMVIGERVRASDQDRLFESGAYHLDLQRRSLRRLMGSGPRDHQVYRLIQNLMGCPIPPDVDPFGYRPSMSVVSPAMAPRPLASPAPAPPGEWQTYSQPPVHIDRKDLEELFGALAEDRPGWERDS